MSRWANNWPECDGLTLAEANAADIALLQAKLKYPSWSFRDRGVGGGVAYLGGFYQFGGADWTPSGGDQTFGDAVNSYSAHAAIILGGASTDMVVRVSGTSITDDGVRTPGDFEDIDTSGGGLNDYFETSKKWNGTVTFHLQIGTSVDCNYGYTKYWDQNNTSFTVLGLEIIGFAAKNNAAFNVELIHHKATGWTYNAAAEPDPPVIYDLQTDHGAEAGIRANDHFNWKRVNLSTVVGGAGSEGTLFRVTTASNNEIDFLTAQLVMVL